MKERTGLDAIGYLGDILWDKSDSPIPSIRTLPWKPEQQLARVEETEELADPALGLAE
jgi:hypothetical protein